jgi:thermostable 8-oxoguanine DNA glycosylase
MPTTIVGQNGKPIEQTTKIALIGCGGVLGSKVKKLSRAQQLAKALKTCKSRYRKRKSKRIACERQARKKYGPKPKKKTSKKK